jgi:hypothetical protein
MFTAKYAKNNTFKTFVREKIGKEYSLVFMTVRKYENYAEALDVIYRSCPEFVNEHLAGRLRMSIERIESLSSLPMATVFSECRRWLSEPLETRLGRRRGKNPCSTQGDKAEELPSVSVKDMPAYDPDAEIVSLALTIPSWRSSIARVKAVSDIKETSREARLRLVEALILLKSTTDKLIYVLKEG